MFEEKKTEAEMRIKRKQSRNFSNIQICGGKFDFKCEIYNGNEN